MIVNASFEWEFRYRNKAVKRHFGLHLFQVLCRSSGCCSSIRTAPPLRERRTHPLMIRSEGITLPCQPIKLIPGDTALKRPRETKFWHKISPVSLHVRNLHKHSAIQPSKIRINVFYLGGDQGGVALSPTMGNLITGGWKNQLYCLSGGDLAVSIVFNVLALWATSKNF